MKQSHHLQPVDELARTHQLGELQQHFAAIPFWRNVGTYFFLVLSGVLMLLGLGFLFGGILGLIPLGLGLFLLVIWIRYYPPSEGGIYLYTDGFIQVRGRRQDVARWDEVTSRVSGPHGSFYVRLNKTNKRRTIGFGVGYFSSEALGAFITALESHNMR